MECQACGAEISEKAADCPQCGASVRDLPGGDEPTDDAVSNASGHNEPTVPGASPDNGESGEVDSSEAETTLVDTDEEERDDDSLDQETTSLQETSTGDPESPGTEGQDVSTHEPESDANGQQSSTGGQDTADDDGTADAAPSEGIDPVAQIKELPFLTAPLAGVVTAAVLAVLSVVVGVLVPNTGSDPVTVGAVVLMDLHFATSVHVTTGILTQFDTARPPNSVLGILYLLPPLFLYTAAKFVSAYNTDESTLTPVAGVGGSLVAVGYFPAMLVALFIAPGGPFSPVSLLPAVLLAGIVYPVFFGFVGGVAGGAFSGSERRINTLYGVVACFVVAIGAFVFTIPSIQASGVGLLPQIHASLYTVVAANGFSLGGAGTGFLVLLAYPLVAVVLFAAGLLRAWNAEDVAGPLRGLGKGLSLSPTYFTLLGLLATLLPLLADPWVVDELGFSFTEAALVQGPIESEFFEIGRYVTVVFVGTLVYAIFPGGIGGTVAGTARYVLSDEN